MDILEKLKTQPCNLEMDQEAANEIERLRDADAFSRAELARGNQIIDALRVERDRLRAENERLRALLIRYRTETPLGHQPYMIADEVDAALAAGGE